MKHKQLTDAQILQIDREQRKAKLTKNYHPQQPDNVLRCLNEINNNLGIIITELRRISETLDYVLPSQPKE